MIAKIIEIKSIRTQIHQLSQREKELSKPILTDLNKIPLLFEWFKEAATSRPNAKWRDDVTMRKKFIFIIMLLYSPATLAGKKMKKGLRDKLCEVLEIHGKSSVSDNLNNLVFSYQLYKYFRQDIDRIYNYITTKLCEYSRQ